MDVSSILDQLNQSQREAVSAPGGNVMVLAGAGSGKTRVLVHRIAWYIQAKRCNPSSILAVTFTNKAATEMRERIEILLASEPLGMWMGTFHGLSHRILRSHWQEAGLPRDFTIIDNEDQQRVIRRIIRSMQINESDLPIRKVQGFINSNKDKGLRSAHIHDQGDHALYQMIRIYKAYEEICRQSGSVDFSELLLSAHELLRDQQQVLQKYRSRFRFILVDEFQDTNALQYAWLKLLIGEQGSLFVVGDDDQCLNGATTVAMGDGLYKPISEVSAGESVLSGSSADTLNLAKVTACQQRRHRGTLVNLYLQTGRLISSTPEHTHFAAYCPGQSLQIYFLCLMYKEDKGYWLRTSQVYGDGPSGAVCQFMRHFLQERADALWFIRTHADIAAADLDKTVTATEYNLPLLPCGISSVRSLPGDTVAAGECLLADVGLSPQRPHYIRQDVCSSRSLAVVELCLHSPARAPVHRISMFGINAYNRNILQAAGFDVHADRRPGHWRFEAEDFDFGVIMEWLQQIRKIPGLKLLFKARLGQRTLPFINAIDIRPGMLMMTAQGVLEQICHIECSPSDTMVYDINVEPGHNFIANGVFTHNSIYSWRGAKTENMQKFKKDFADPLFIRLEQNYRSTANILNAANALIANNSSRLGKQLWTEAGAGDKIILYHSYNEHDEARYVAERVGYWRGETSRYQESAVLYRVSAQSRVIEKQLMLADIPYRVYGGMRFYERAEIKDVLAYARLSVSHDDVSFERIVNTPARGIGQRTLEDLRSLARQQGFSLWQAANKILQDELLPQRPLGALRNFVQLITDIAADHELPLYEILENIIQASNLKEHYGKEKGERGLTRIENIEELVNAAREFSFDDDEQLSPLSAFLAQATLESGEGQVAENADSVSLMTLHAAKGLEFDNVYLVGMEEGLFPHQRCIADPVLLEEERRLCYVGITRARRALTVTHANRRNLHGKEYYSQPSRFIKELPEQLIDKISMQRAMVGTTTTTALSNNGIVQKNAVHKSAPVKSRYTSGQRVSHEKFGEGVIINLEGSGENTKLQVNFKYYGIKWLLAEYAGLKIL